MRTVYGVFVTVDVCTEQIGGGAIEDVIILFSRDPCSIPRPTAARIKAPLLALLLLHSSFSRHKAARGSYPCVVVLTCASESGVCCINKLSYLCLCFCQSLSTTFLLRHYSTFVLVPNQSEQQCRCQALARRPMLAAGTRTAQTSCPASSTTTLAKCPPP